MACVCVCVCVCVGGGGDYIHVAKNMEGIMSTYTKMSRRDFVREGYCPYTLLIVYQELRGIDTLPGETTLSVLFCLLRSGLLWKQRICSSLELMPSFKIWQKTVYLLENKQQKRSKSFSLETKNTQKNETRKLGFLFICSIVICRAAYAPPPHPLSTGFSGIRVWFSKKPE